MTSTSSTCLLNVMYCLLKFGYFFIIPDDDSEKYVSILLDGEESTLEFVDLSDQEVSA